MVRDEIEGAPKQVKQYFHKISEFADHVDISDESVQLQQAYLRAGIVSKKWEADALHVALATVNLCPIIVSWNFKHIVHFQRIPMYNGVNMSNGYLPISIHSPLEVIYNDDKD